LDPLREDDPARATPPAAERCRHLQRLQFLDVDPEHDEERVGQHRRDRAPVTGSVWDAKL
jgi:hypothetical protein